jgi:hypothetical protein
VARHGGQTMIGADRDQACAAQAARADAAQKEVPDRASRTESVTRSLGFRSSPPLKRPVLSHVSRVITRKRPQINDQRFPD